MEVVRELGRIAAGKQHPHRVGRAGALASEQHALDPGLPLGRLALQRAAALGEARGLDTQPRAFGLQRRERAIRFRDRALRSPQRIARLVAHVLFLLQPAIERLDAAAQSLQVFFAGGGALRGAGPGKPDEKGSPAQARAFPCEATEATRLAISSASPR